MKKLDNITFWSSLTAIVLIWVYFGIHSALFPDWLFNLILLAYNGFMGYVSYKKIKHFKQAAIKIFNYSLVLLSVLLSFHSLINLFTTSGILSDGLFFGLLVFQIVIGISGKLAHSIRSGLHPALVFVLSFAILILLGSFMLMLPKATHNGITFLQAIFTSTSAVTVTGLAVLDTGKDFTLFGQSIILILIQLGGLGVLTFSNLFAMLFSGGTTFRDQIVMSDFINSENISNTQRTLIKIVSFVFITEMIGAILIYLSIASSPIEQDKFFFSTFHAISAFCNAGFSTLSNSLYEGDMRYNYSLQVIIAFLFILGGLGYNIFINYASYIRYFIANLVRRLFNLKIQFIRPQRIIRINTIIVVRTTLALIFIGWIAFFFLEYNNTLKEHNSFWSKLAVSFFGAVTPRTAGFNSVDTGALLTPTIIIYILLMWIGASPGSTGGGIKTTTLAIALLNIKNQLLGKERIEFRKKEIPGTATQRATVIISLSLMAIVAGTFSITLYNPELDILKVVFECFSAFSTVGLSMGITADFCDAGHWILIVLMFLGRVSFLTFLMAVVRQFYEPKQCRYQYPKEDIFIN